MACPEAGADYRSWLDFEQTQVDVPEGNIFDPWRLRPKSLAEFNRLSEDPSRLSRDQLVYLSWYGLLGPTAHNTVPQRLRFSSGESALDVWGDRQFVLRHSDKDGRQAAVSLGCVVGNIEQAARCYGLKPHVEVFPEAVRMKPYVSSEDRYTRVLRVNFEQGAASPEDHQWLTAILRRKVVRAEYDRRVRLEASLIGQMQARVQGRYPTIQLHLLTQNLVLQGLGKFQEQADKFVFEQGPFAEELGKWLIPNDDNENPLAMRGREFGWGDDFARRIHEGLSRTGDRLLADEIANFARGGKEGMKSSSAVGVLTVIEDTPEQQVEAGRAYEDLALFLCLRDFWTSIHAGMTEVVWVNRAFAATVLRTIRRPTVVFRIGQSKRLVDAERPHSARPAVEATFLPEEVGSG